jgi:hypothetical protein
LLVFPEKYTLQNNNLSATGQLVARFEQEVARFLREKIELFSVSP